jgi:hypothetical protein
VFCKYSCPREYSRSELSRCRGEDRAFRFNKPNPSIGKRVFQFDMEYLLAVNKLPTKLRRNESQPHVIPYNINDYVEAAKFQPWREKNTGFLEEAVEAEPTVAIPGQSYPEGHHLKKRL